MRTPPPVRRPFVLFLALILLSGTFAFAQPPQQSQPFKPEVGQGGKDVVWVPTPRLSSTRCSTWPASPRRTS